MTAVTAPTTSRARARDVPRAIYIAAAGNSRPDGKLKYHPIGHVLQAIMAVCILLNNTVSVIVAAFAHELYVSKGSMCILGLRGPDRSARSRYAQLAAGGSLVLLLLLGPALLTWLVVGILDGGLEGLVVATIVATWTWPIYVAWTLAGVAVHFIRTQAYWTEYRDGVPASYWLLSSAAALRRAGDGFTLADTTARAIVPSAASTVTVARTKMLALIYARSGFRPLREGKLVLVRP